MSNPADAPDISSRNRHNLGVQVRLFGPVSARHDGTELALGGLKQRAVFALLALHADRIVSMDRLVDEVWHEEPPAQATVALRSYVSRLRRVLTGTGCVIETRPPGWVLRIAVEQVDVIRFARLVSEGRLLTDVAEQPDRACALLSEALELWVGEPLADLTGLEFARHQAVRLVELNQDAGELLLEARLATGAQTGVIEAARQFVGAHPYRERAWCALMLALYRNGQQSEAIAAYAELRGLLQDELGLDPSPQARELQAKILRHDPDLKPPTWMSRAAAPQAGTPHLVSVTSGDPEVLLVGRAPALAQLGESWSEARAGSGRLLLLEASAGAGKSALLQALGTQVRESGGQVLQANGVGDDAVPALWPWVSIIRQLLSEVPGVDSPTSSGPAALAVAMLGRLTDLDPQRTEDSQLAQTTLYRGVVDLLLAARHAVPLAVVIDDLQWVDRDTLTLLALVVDQLAPAGVLFAVAVRPDEASSATVTQMINTLCRDRVTRIELPPLRLDDVTALTHRLAGRPVEPGVTRAIADRTSGHPLFVTELVRLLVAEGQLNEQAVLRTLPSGVRDVLQRRIDRLPKETVSLLGVAALVGPSLLDVDLLAAVTGLSENDVLDRCEAALLTGLLVENAEAPGAFGLSHDLVRQTLVAGLSGARRVRWHTRIAAALQRRSFTSPEQVVQIARQLTLAAPAVGPAAAIPYLISASEDALSRYARGSALTSLQSALTMASAIADPVQRQVGERQVKGLLAGLQTLARPSPPSPSAADAAPHLAEPTDAHSAAGWFSSVMSETMVGRYDWGRAAAHEVLAHSPSPYGEIVARFILGWVSYVCGDLEAGVEHLAALEGDIERGIDTGPLSHLAESVAGYRALIAHARGDDAAASALMDLARRRAGSQNGVLNVALFESTLAAMRGERVIAAARAAETERIARLTQYPIYAIVAGVIAAWSEGLSSGSPEAVDQACARFEATGVRAHLVTFLLLQAEVHEAVGDLAGAVRVASRAQRVSAEFGEACMSPRLSALAERLLHEMAADID